MVEHLLQHPEDRPLKPEKPLITSVVANSYNQADNGEDSPVQMPRQPLLLDFSGDSKMAQMLARRRQMVEEGVTSEPITVTKSPVEPIPRPAPVTPQRIAETTSGAISRSKTEKRPEGSSCTSAGRVKSMMIPPTGVDMQSELKNRIAGGRGGLRKIQRPPVPDRAPPTPNTAFRQSIALQKGKSASSSLFRRFITEPKANDEDNKLNSSDSAVNPPEPVQNNTNSPPARPVPTRGVMRGRGRGGNFRGRGGNFRGRGGTRQSAPTVPSLVAKEENAQPEETETEKEVPISPRKVTAVENHPTVVKYPAAPPPRPNTDVVSAKKPPAPPRARPVSAHPRITPLQTNNKNTTPETPVVKPVITMTPLRDSPPTPIKSADRGNEANVSGGVQFRKTMPSNISPAQPPARPSPNLRNTSVPKIRELKEPPNRPPPVPQKPPNGVPPVPPKPQEEENKADQAENGTNSKSSSLSLRSRLDLLIEAADDYIDDKNEAGEDDIILLLAEHKNEKESKPIPPKKPQQDQSPPKPSKSKLEMLIDADEESDPIQELLDFVESESTPLEKLLGLETPSRASNILPPELPANLPEPAAPPPKVPAEDGPPTQPPPRPPSRVQPAAMPSRTQTAPPSRQDSVSAGSRRSMFLRRKKETKKEDKEEEVAKKRSKRFSRFGKKDKELKTSTKNVSGALAQPGITWGKSKDAEAILEKLRSEGLV